MASPKYRQSQSSTTLRRHAARKKMEQTAKMTATKPAASKSVAKKTKPIDPSFGGIFGSSGIGHGKERRATLPFVGAGGFVGTAKGAQMVVSAQRPSADKPVSKPKNGAKKKR